MIDWSPNDPAAHACPACHARGGMPPLLRVGVHVLHRCPGCRACFYASRCAPDYAAGTGTDAFFLQLYLEQNASIHHATRLLFLVEHDGIDSVLDVGCGFGFAPDLAATALNWRAMGIDPSPMAGAGGTILGAPIRQAYFGRRSAIGAPFGLVLASETIEHVADPLGFLLLLRARLQPGGVVVLSTPDADAIRPEAGMELEAILAPGAHLVLFAASTLEAMLHRAGFAHVAVETNGQTLVAIASDRPIRRMADGAARHEAAYCAYLDALMARAAPGSPLWNGAAGRWLQMEAARAPVAAVAAVLAQVAAAWSPAVDLDRPPAPDAGDMHALAARHPVNLATILFAQAELAMRALPRDPAAVLRRARLALVHAVDTVCTLQAGGMIDLDLRTTARRARLMVVDALVELAPEMEAELLAGLAAPEDPLLALPPELLQARLAAGRSAAARVAAGRALSPSAAGC